MEIKKPSAKLYYIPGFLFALAIALFILSGLLIINDAGDDSGLVVLATAPIWLFGGFILLSGLISLIAVAIIRASKK